MSFLKNLFKKKSEEEVLKELKENILAGLAPIFESVQSVSNEEMAEYLRENVLGIPEDEMDMEDISDGFITLFEAKMHNARENFKNLYFTQRKAANKLSENKYIEYHVFVNEASNALEQRMHSYIMSTYLNVSTGLFEKMAPTTIMPTIELPEA